MSNSPSSPLTDVASVVLSSPRISADDVICSLAPTSSLNGVYARSRPASVEIPHDYLNSDFCGFSQAGSSRNVQRDDQSESTDHLFYANSFPTLSNEHEPNLTAAASSEFSHGSFGATSDVYTEYFQENAARRTSTETCARVQTLSDARPRNHCAESISTSIKTTASKNVRSLESGHDGDREVTYQNMKDGSDLANVPEMITGQTRVHSLNLKRSIPLFSRVTKKFYGVFHRKSHSTSQSIQVDPSLPAALTLELKPTETVELSPLSPLSLFKKRYPTSDSQKVPSRRRSKNIFSIRRDKDSVSEAPNTVKPTSTSLAIENHACLRRPVSFAGFGGFPKLDEGLDEATAEATRVANKTSMMFRLANLQRQQGSDLDEDDHGHVF